MPTISEDIAVELTGSGTVGDVQGGWSVTENATPVSVAETSGTVGSASFVAARTGSSQFVQNNLVTLTSRRRSWRGRVTSAPLDRLSVVVSADGDLSFLTSVKTAPPAGVFGAVSEHRMRLSAVYRMYVELCDPGLEFHGFEYQARDPLVAYPGWTDRVFTKLKQLGAATHTELTIVNGVVTVRNVGTRWLTIPPATSVTVTPSTQDSARLVEVVNQNVDVGDGLTMWAADRIYAIDVGQVETVTVTTPNSPVSLNDPVALIGSLAYPGRYLIQDKDEKPVLPSQWAYYGGTILPTIGATPNQIEITFQGPRGLIPGHQGPFSFADGSGVNRVPALSITGSGVTTDPETIVLHTGADESKVTADSTQRVDIPFLTSAAEVYDRGVYATQQAGGPQVRIDFTIPRDPELSFGEYQGRLVRWENSIYRITSATIRLLEVTCSATWHVSYGDLPPGTTLEDLDAIWAGFDFGDRVVEPLRQLAPVTVVPPGTATFTEDPAVKGLYFFTGLVEDPDVPGLYGLPVSSEPPLTEDPDVPGLFKLGADTDVPSLTEDPNVPGLFFITGPGFTEDPAAPGLFHFTFESGLVPDEDVPLIYRYMNGE